MGLDKLIYISGIQAFVVFSGKSVCLEIFQRLCVHRAEKGYKHDCLSVISFTHIRKLNYKHSPRFISGEVRKRTQKIWIANETRKRTQKI